MGDWLAKFRRLVRQVRARGWSCPFVLHGELYVPIDMTSAACPRRHHNDNRKL